MNYVVNDKFPHLKDRLDNFFDDLPFERLPLADERHPQGIPDIRDIKDLPILVTAILGNVDVLVTGDDDFLVLQTERPEIMTMAQFVDKYGQSDRY